MAPGTLLAPPQPAPCRPADLLPVALFLWEKADTTSSIISFFAFAVPSTGRSLRLQMREVPSETACLILGGLPEG
jgi:hypothetical protein